MPQNRLLDTAAVLPSGVCAGIIESSSGNASVTPMPRKNVRRGKCLLGNECHCASQSAFRSVVCCCVNRFFHSHLKRRALHNSQHQLGEPVAIAGRILHNRAHHGHVVILAFRGPLHTSAIFPSWLRRRPPDGSAGPCASWTGPSTLVPSTSWPDASILNPESASRHWPDAVEILERQPDGVHDLMATGAHRIGAMFLHALADRSRRRAASEFSFSGGTLGGGRGGGLPSRFSRIHLPRCTGEVRLALDVTSSMLPCPSRPRRASLGTGTRRKSGP